MLFLKHDRSIQVAIITGTALQNAVATAVRQRGSPQRSAKRHHRHQYATKATGKHQCFCYNTLGLYDKNNII